MRFIADQMQVLVAKPKQTFEAPQPLVFIPDLKSRQGQRLTREKLFDLLEMIPVDMIIAKRVIISGPQPRR